MACGATVVSLEDSPQVVSPGGSGRRVGLADPGTPVRSGARVPEVGWSRGMSATARLERSATGWRARREAVKHAGAWNGALFGGRTARVGGSTWADPTEAWGAAPAFPVQGMLGPHLGHRGTGVGGRECGSCSGGRGMGPVVVGAWIRSRSEPCVPTVIALGARFGASYRHRSGVTAPRLLGMPSRPNRPRWGGLGVGLPPAPRLGRRLRLSLTTVARLPRARGFGVSLDGPHRGRPSGESRSNRGGATSRRLPVPLPARGWSTGRRSVGRSPR